MQNHNGLRLALRLNAVFSTCSAVGILLAYDFLSELMGVYSEILISAAMGLAGFAGYLVFTAARTDTAKLRREALQHSISDFAWVVGSLVVVALGLVSEAGNAILIAVCVPVLVLGVAQWRGVPSVQESGASGVVIKA
ncbi:MAG: hypothetical protein ACI8W3_000068 [Myxococcota bacterium]|jgi:hypothetical protein